jgi:exopolyphosphatase/guanosine-5'-triphosphate,3'-diphosphate pyrophosphatase
MQRVLDVCAEYREAIDSVGVERVVAVMTSAVRDAQNGAELQRALSERFGFDARTIPGEREARLTYAGATAGRHHDAPTMVLDIGGGSTEVVVGHAGRIDFFVSTQLGSVRHTERHLHTDPPTAEEVAACRAAARDELGRAVPPETRASVREGIAVAGTPTSFAAIDLRLDPYDPERVEGHRLTRAAGERILEELARLPVDERRRVTGLHPDRAPTIVAGGVILLEAMGLFGLDEIEISERDILHGAALEAALEAPKSAE